MYPYKTNKTTTLSKKITQWAGILTFASLITACGGGGGSSSEDLVVVTPPQASAGSVQFATSAIFFNEADGSIQITVTRTNGSEGDVSVDYMISNGTASAADYNTQNMSGTLSWSDSDSQIKTININIVDDLLVEDNEVFNINLSNAINDVSLGVNNSTQINIIDNDSLTTTPNSLYFYVSENAGVNGVYAYDSKNITEPVDSILVDDNTQGENILSLFNQSSTTPGLASDVSSSAIMYIKGGMIWKVISDSVSTLSKPIQVSSDNNVQLCGQHAFVNEEPNNLDGSRYFYLDAGVDGACDTEDDQWKYVKFGWNNSVSPVLTMDFISDISDDNNSSDPVFLAWDDATSGLFKCSISCDFIRNLDFKPSIFGFIDDVKKEYLLMDNNIVILDIVEKTLSDPIYTSNSLFFMAIDINDGAYSYFSDAGKIYKLDSLGNAPLELIDEGANKIIFMSLFAMSNERLIYSVIDMSNRTSEIRTLLKTGGESKQLVSSSESDLLISGKGGDRIYYSYTQAGTSIAGMVLIDGSNKTESLNQKWVGFTQPTTFSVFSGIDFFNIYGLDETSQTISVYDAASFTLKKQIGTLPSDVSDVLFLGLGDIARAYATEKNTFSFDLFYSDAGSDAPLVRVTSTLNINDAVIMY